MITVVMIFILGFIIGALWIGLMMVIPLQKTNSELLNHIEQCEYECWNKIK